MDIEATDRFNNKRIHQRLGPSKPNKVCFYWQSGRCNRHPCPYLHGELPQSLDGGGGGGGGGAASTKRAHHQNFAGGDGGGFRSNGLVWKNPSTGGNPGPPASWGKGRGGSEVNRMCKYFLLGKCSYGDQCKFLHSWFVGDSFSLLTPLQGHQKVITGIALPSGSDKMYSGSKDESVRVWDCQSGQCVGVVKMGGEVGCMINEGPWIFIGIPNAVKAWNTQTSTDLSLDGPVGQVYALVVGSEMLFAGTQDGRILAWKFSAVGNCFEPAAALTGHQLSVVSLVVGAGRLYSGSMDNTIRAQKMGVDTIRRDWINQTRLLVWDLTTLQCIQTLTDHTSVVMSVLCWDQFLLSCSLDQTIKVWVATESGKLEATYTHNEEHGVLALCGMHDPQSKPILFCACNDNSVRLYDLPSFNERGKIFAKGEVRAIQVGPGGLFFTGDGTGELKVWTWVAKEATSA